MILDLSKIYIGWYFLSQTLAGFLFYSMEILIAFNKLLTCFQLLPIGSLDSNIFILNPCCRKNKAGYLSSSLRVEIVQFVTWHFLSSVTNCYSNVVCGKKILMVSSAKFLLYQHSGVENDGFNSKQLVIIWNTRKNHVELKVHIWHAFIPKFLSIRKFQR